MRDVMLSHTHTHTHTEVQLCQFFCETILPFFFILLSSMQGSKSFLIYKIYTHTHTHTEVQLCQFFCETILPFFFILLSSMQGLKSFLIYKIFPMLTWLCLPPTRSTWTRFQSNMPPTQLPQHFRRGNTCAVFPLGTRSVSSYVTNST